MTKFSNRSFSVAMPGDKFAENWDRIFGEKRSKKCPVCSEPDSMHWDGTAPGKVFVDGFGVIPCSEHPCLPSAAAKVPMTVRDGKTYYLVVVQNWEESERGWGVRPDGFTLHLTEADRAAYCKAYWSGMPKSAPDEYTRESGEPGKMWVTEETYKRLETAAAAEDEHGIWGEGRCAPGESGWFEGEPPGGWRKAR